MGRRETFMGQIYICTDKRQDKSENVKWFKLK